MPTPQLESICQNYAAQKEATCRVQAQDAYRKARDAANKAYNDAIVDSLAKKRDCDDKNGCPGGWSPTPETIAACRQCLEELLQRDSTALRIRDAALIAAEKAQNCALGYPDSCSGSRCSCCDERQNAYNACIKAKGIPPVIPVVNPPVPAPAGEGDPLKKALDEEFERRRKLYPNQPDLTPM